MSYDIHLRLPEYGPVDDEALEVLEDAAMTEADLLRNRKLVSLLRAHAPAFELFESASVLELSDLESGSGIQISLFAKSGAIALPYWHDSGDAAARLARISSYLKILHEEGGFVAYDPQTERVVSAESGYTLDPSVYSVGANLTKDIGRKRWWKFW